VRRWMFILELVVAARPTLVGGFPDGIQRLAIQSFVEPRSLDHLAYDVVSLQRPRAFVSRHQRVMLAEDAGFAGR